MNRFKKIVLWIVIGAVVACLADDGLRRLETVQGPTHAFQMPSAPYKMSEAEREELEIMRINVSHGARLAWQASVKRTMLVEANWLANRLNLPIRRPIYTTDIQDWLVLSPWNLVLPRYPVWFPDTVFGTDLYNTNFPRLQRILALKFALNGYITTPPYSFSFSNGRVDDIVRLDPNESNRYEDRFAEVMRQPSFHPSLAKTAEAYQLATQWLAAVDVNLDMLEKSRLPHPVRQEEYQLPGASDPQPVNFVAWGTNYYAGYYIYKTWHTNEWHPSVMVEIGPHNELLELYVGDSTFFRNPPTLIPSKTVWRLVHTPDPPVDQLLNPEIMREFILTPEEASNCVYRATHNPLWAYQHHLTNPELTLEISNDLNHLKSELIPYTPSP
jgi:hypothetical protein